MKKLFFLLFLISFATVTVNAQVTKPEQQSQHKKNAECYVMKDGKMYHSMAGKEMLMDKEVTLKNGDKIMPNGTCKMKNGKEMMLKDEECVDMMGKFHKSHMEHHKKG